MSNKGRALSVLGFFGIAAATLIVAGIVIVRLKDKKSVPQVTFATYEFETPLWSQSKNNFLAVRLEALNKNTLLLRRMTGIDRASDKNDGCTYRYSPGQSQLDALPAETWDGAGTPISDVYTKQQEEFSPWSFDSLRYQATANGKAIPTSGAYHKNVILAPGGKRVAVISVEGRSGYGLWPFMGGGGLKGKYYFEVLAKSDASQLSKTIVFPEDGDIHSYGGLWSSDGRYFVVSDSYLTWVAIIPIEEILLKPRE